MKVRWPRLPRALADTTRSGDAALQGVEHWKKFFGESKKYSKVGRVSHPPIDPASDYPEHCDPKKAQAALDRERKAKEEAAGAKDAKR